MKYDRFSYIIGMIAAFSECVAGGCKRLALSPPLTGEGFALVRDEAYRVIEAHGLLSYDAAESVHTGYDAFREAFGEGGRSGEGGRP